MDKIWSNIRAFFQYNWNLFHWRLIKTAIFSNPYDWTYLYKVERAKLEEMKDYMERSEIVDHKECGNLRWIGVCIRLLDIIIEGPEEHPYVNTRNMWRFIRPTDYVKGVKKEDVEQYYKSYPQDLRWVKAEHLYYEIRKEHTTCWWD